MISLVAFLLLISSFMGSVIFLILSSMLLPFPSLKFDVYGEDTPEDEPKGGISESIIRSCVLILSSWSRSIYISSSMCCIDSDWLLLLWVGASSWIRWMRGAFRVLAEEGQVSWSFSEEDAKVR